MLSIAGSRAVSRASIVASRRVYSSLPSKQPSSVITKTMAHRSLSSSKPPNSTGRAGLLLGGFALLTGKAKYILTGMKLFKFTPVLSMIGTSITYSFVFGPAYGVGMVGLITVHEIGHIMALRHYRMPFSPMVMIPFMGAAIAAKEAPNAWQGAVIAGAGPIVGTVGAVACTAAAGATDSQLLYALADFGYMINLFNLLPLGTLDGGRIADAIHPSFGVAGVVGGAGLAYTGAVSNPIFYLVLASGAWSTGKRLFGYDDRPPSYYLIPTTQRLGVSAGYFGLMGGLIFLMNENGKRKRSPRELGLQGPGLDEQIESYLFVDETRFDGDDDGKWV